MTRSVAALGAFVASVGIASAATDSAFKFPAAGRDEPRSSFITHKYLLPAGPIRFAQANISYQARLLTIERTPIAPGALPSAREGHTEIVSRLEIRAPGQHRSVPIPDLIAYTYLTRRPPDSLGCSRGLCSTGYLTPGFERGDVLTRRLSRIAPGGRAVEEFVSQIPESFRRREIRLYLIAPGRQLQAPSPANRLTRTVE